ncbi:MAG: HAD-IA family hydrolase [Saprospiraceae bacterium]|nr:HAD-IA family hydrolase [Saprospiraceae bacterium]
MSGAVRYFCPKSTQGKDKKVIIQNVLLLNHLPLSMGDEIYRLFKTKLTSDADKFSLNRGTIEIMMYLRERGIKTGIGTGLERDIFDIICNHVKLDNSFFDYVGISNEVGRGRPFPDMIFDMMLKLDITDKAKVLKVGDTVADIEEGQNANVLTAVILSGTQPEEWLLKAKPDFVLRSLSELKNILQ